MEDNYMNQNGLSVMWSKIKSKITEFINAKFVDGVLPIESGGTSGSTASEAIIALTKDLPSSSGSIYYSEFFIPTYIQSHLDDPERTYKMTFYQLLMWVSNRGNTVNQANTNYTTYMARGIAILNSVPGSMVNGTCAFLII